MKKLLRRTPSPAGTGPAPRSRTALALVAAPLAALLLAVTGCSSGSESGSESGSPSGSGAFPATVQTTFGDVTVEEKPERVVALGWGDAETALALGVQPVGQSDWLEFGGDGVGPWAKGRYDERPQKIGTLEPEYEKIAALKPDLILDTKSSGDQERYDTLSKIAPTVGIPEGGERYMSSWKKQTEMVSTALGEEKRGRQLIRDVEGEFAAAKKKHPEFHGKTVTLGSRTASSWGAYVHGTGRAEFVERLGFENNPAVEKRAGKNFSVSVSEENLDQLDADLMVTAPIGVTAKKIESDPLYRKIPAVADGRALVFEDDSNLGRAFATDSVLSVSYALDKVVPLFAEHVK
ncbi:iron-siderophore ABC transporter substrate-binding protein [Streptomyces sp. HNM0574]|uniref:iron-siderophore ABC transporter substrate-binding protein n=1 Tax=Streptomyces sp. HNM0574 TaxID=2714954 RepID=UPI00146A5F3B|nr:iron-siderophore ABC transporter substrate-binding protein [Streptomyces sp. HNM0574]NLU69407.1 iron-siderophore ABC transporter substrate-binding protein [Streptomyces sp. HNM0574]